MARPVPDAATCAACGYSLRGLRSTAACPECGYAVAASLDVPPDGPSAGEARWVLAYAAAAGGIVALGTAAGLGLFPSRLGWFAFASCVCSFVGFAMLMTTGWVRLPLAWLAWVTASVATYVFAVA